MDPENLLRRKSDTKVTCCRIPFIGNIQSGQIHRDRDRISGCQGLGAMAGHRSPFWGDDNVLTLAMVVAA